VDVVEWLSPSAESPLLVEQQHTRLCEFHAARQTMKEGSAQFPLEAADLEAEARSLDSQPLGSAGEMQLLGNRDEIAEMSEFHGPTPGVDRLGTLLSHRENPLWIFIFHDRIGRPERPKERLRNCAPWPHRWQLRVAAVKIVAMAETNSLFDPV
jgi:hypothetical protein